MPTGSGKYGFVRRSGYPPWNGWKINFLLGFGPFLGACAVSSQFQGILHSFMKHGPGLSRCIFYWTWGVFTAIYVRNYQRVIPSILRENGRRNEKDSGFIEAMQVGGVEFSRFMHSFRNGPWGENCTIWIYIYTYRYTHIHVYYLPLMGISIVKFL